jgi:hypothetical protein
MTLVNRTVRGSEAHAVAVAAPRAMRAVARVSPHHRQKHGIAVVTFESRKAPLWLSTRAAIFATDRVGNFESVRPSPTPH